MDRVLAVFLFGCAAVFLYQRKMTSMIMWLGLAYVITHYVCHMSHTVSVISGILGVYLISMVTHQTFEGFEEEKKEKEPEAAPPKTDDPHVDVGTTILHAYRNLSPEQIGGMRRDTKELMGLQKELMGSLSEMKPAIEQGAELLKTFGQFFGKNE
jgi:hypothetical protein